MVKMVPYLNLPNAKKAIELYEKLFDAKVLDHRPFSKDQPTQLKLPDNFDYGNSTVYAMIEVLGLPIHMSDTQSSVSPMGMVDIYFELDKEEQINKIYEQANALGCKINVPLAKQFWGALYTNFKDPVGITWQLSCAPSQSQENKDNKISSSKKTSKNAKKTSKSSKKTSKKATKKTTKKKT